MTPDSRIAIIGMDGLFPEADNLAQFYANLRDGRDSVRALSAGRMRYSCLDPSLNYRRMGSLERVDWFDHPFFNVPKAEADVMDPQQRLLLQLACGAIENGGYRLSQLSGTRTGVFLSATHPTYDKLMDTTGANAVIGNLNAAIAGRIAYLLNLQGPALMIDTACSSSLAATIEACKNLLSGWVDYAIAGGININTFFPVRNAEAGLQEVEAPDEKCKAFDGSANGIVGGEGGGVVVLKRLAEALRDGDVIHAVISGFASNQDGNRAVGLTAPSPLAQTELLVEAWRQAGIGPETVSYVEAHGTGTKLGDPIELRALSDAFARHTGLRQFCAVGSLKTNIGHLDAAAGIAGLLKAVLSLKYGQLFASLHYRTPNPLIDLSGTALRVNDRLRDWTPPAGAPRRAGVSAFGLTGTNTHVVLEEAPAPPPVSPPVPPGYLLKVSAKTPAALAQYHADLRAHLLRTPTAPADFCYTLNCGRDDYAYRAAYVFGDVAEAIRLLHGDPATPPRERKTNCPLVVLFPGDVSQAGPPAEPLLAYPAFKGPWEACCRLLGATPGGRARTFAFQYAAYRLLQSLGVDTRYLVGNGAGNLVISVVGGQLSLAEGLARAAVAPPPESPDPAKLSAYFSQLTQPLVLELGGESQLGRLAAGLPGVVAVPLPAAATPHWPLEVVAALYRQGVAVDWPAAYAGQPRRRVEAPTYPFEKIRCWHRSPGAAAPDVQEWLFDTTWVPYAPSSSGPSSLRQQTWLLLMDEAGLGEALSACLAQGQNRVIRVYPGKAFRQINPDRYEIAVAAEGDYAQLHDALRAAGALPDGIIHLGNCSPASDPAAVGPDEALSGGVFGQFLLVKAFSPLLSRRNTRLVLVSANAWRVGDEDAAEHPERAAAFGFFRGVLAEYDKVAGKCIDISLTGSGGVAAAAAGIWREMHLENDLLVAAYRGEQRYVQSLRRLGAPGASVPIPELVRDGVYLVTGGTGGIGYEICQYLVARQRICLVVAGRTSLPYGPGGAAGHPPTDPSVREKLERLSVLAGSGSQVHYYPADTAAPGAMAALYAQVTAAHGKIRGVVHSAALPGARRIEHNTPAEFRRVFYSRVQAAVSLAEAARRDPADFVVLFSSISCLLPVTPRKADYAAGCAMTDAYVRKHARSIPGLQVIHWCDWQETGMSWRTSEDQAAYASRRAFLHLKNAEGVAVFERCLAAGYVAVTPFGNTRAATPADLEHLRGNPFFAVHEAFAALPAAGPAQSLSESAPPPVTATPDHGLEQEATGTEKQLAGIWAEVLKREQFSRHDDFFDLGGQSLTGFSILRRVEKNFGVALEMDDLFEYGTIKDLAGRIDSLRQPVPAAGLLPEIARVPPQPHYPLSRGQQRLWVLSQLTEEWVAYNEPKVHTLEGAFDVAAFEAAFRALVERHEILRTRLITVDGLPRQQVLTPEDADFRLAYQDRRNEPRQAQFVEAFIGRDAGTPFGKEGAPLLRATVLRLEDRKYVLVCTLHHIISDGWSTGIMIRDLAALYNALREGRPNPLPPLRVQFKDWVAWQNDRLAGEKLRESEQYWLSQFAGAPALHLPLDAPRPAVRNRAGRQLHLPLDPALSAQLLQLGTRYDCTLFATLLAAYNAWLYYCTGQSDLTVGYPSAGRDHPDLEDQIGFYLNLNALRVRFDPEAAFVDLLQQTRQVLTKNHQYQAYPFDLLVEKLDAARSPNRHPLFDVVMDTSDFNAATGADAHPSLADVTIHHRDVQQSYSRFDLTLYCFRDGDTIHLALEYCTDIFAPATIERLAAHFRQILGRIGEDPRQSIEDICQEALPTLPLIYPLMAAPNPEVIQ